MASEISWEFEELAAYIKRLQAELGGPTGTQVATVSGPGGGPKANAATQFRSQLLLTAGSFGRAMENYREELKKAHDDLAAVLAAAVEADASLADEAREISRLIDGAAVAATPPTAVPDAVKSAAAAAAGTFK